MFTKNQLLTTGNKLLNDEQCKSLHRYLLEIPMSILKVEGIRKKKRQYLAWNFFVRGTESVKMLIRGSALVWTRPESS